MRAQRTSGPCRYCGEATGEKDRSGQWAHPACVARLVATVVEEARPSVDSADLARRLREQDDHARELHQADEMDSHLLAGVAQLRRLR